MGANATQSTRRAMIITGSYVGNFVDNRTIDIGINLFAKEQAFVLVRSLNVGRAVFRTDQQVGDISYYFDETPWGGNLIQEFNNTGFVVGDDNQVNQNGVSYSYIVIWEEP